MSSIDKMFSQQYCHLVLQNHQYLFFQSDNFGKLVSCSTSANSIIKKHFLNHTVMDPTVSTTAVEEMKGKKILTILKNSQKMNLKKLPKILLWKERKY